MWLFILVKIIGGYMTFLSEVNNIHNKFTNIEGIEVSDINFKDPVKLSDIEKLEKNIGHSLPKSLKEIYINETSKLLFDWSAEPDLFGIDCKSGYIKLLSPEEVMEKVFEMKEMVEEGNNNQEELDSNEGLRALVNDWGHWIPIFSFPNGDAFCIDTRKDKMPIVFLEHDVMDGGPYIHGTIIAASFEDLLEIWSKVSFVDIYDWSIAVDGTGLNIENPIFDKIRES